MASSKRKRKNRKGRKDNSGMGYNYGANNVDDISKIELGDDMGFDGVNEKSTLNRSRRSRKGSKKRKNISDLDLDFDF